MRQELETLLDEVESQLSDVRVHAEQAKLEAAHWLRRSELAAAEGRDDLARQALAHRAAFAESAADWQVELCEVEAMHDALRAALDLLVTAPAATDQEFSR